MLERLAVPASSSWHDCWEPRPRLVRVDAHEVATACGRDRRRIAQLTAWLSSAPRGRADGQADAARPLACFDLCDGSSRALEAARAALLIGDLAEITAARFVLGLIGGVLLPLAVSASSAPARRVSPCWA